MGEQVLLSFAYFQIHGCQLVLNEYVASDPSPTLADFVIMYASGEQRCGARNDCRFSPTCTMG